jgi:hypothetical protein
MIISFAWTIDVLLAGRKNCTRRRWSDRYFRKWVKAWREGRHIHDAYDRLPIVGGTKQADIRLTCEPYRERLGDMPEEDLEAEGGLWVSKEEFIELFGGDPEEVVVVVRFTKAEELSTDSGNGLNGKERRMKDVD